MKQLWIKYTDENGEKRRVQIEKDAFVIGRHSACDLTYPSGNLSREHLKIERKGKIFTVTDPGSSNGTELNGSRLLTTSEIRNGDRADLGGGLVVDFELIDPNAPQQPEIEDEAPSESSNAAAPDVAIPTAAPAPAMSAAPPAPSGGFKPVYLLLAPLLVIILLVFVVGFILIFKSNSTTVTSDSGVGYNRHSTDPDDDPTPSKNSASSTPSGSSTPTNSNSSTTTGSDTPQPSPSVATGDAKMEQSAAAFLRRIAQNDPTAFLTAEQSQKVSAKIKQLSGSSPLADNINSARKSASQIKTLAASKNLKPQLLATAGLVKLGTSRGDALQAAQSMADVLGKLQTQIGSELSDDSLLMIAAYDQGQSGDFQKLRNMLQDLATKFPESARQIRSIWFLQKQGKITDAEFDFALRFIAIGTITQSPKDFGVNTEPLTL
jgi:pSer/pThr/pTyr-binding forkhead associated (FHA) protein